MHHYCFAREVNVITNHKPLVAIFKKDVVTLSQRIQCILLRIHQYRVRILYKLEPKIFIADWLCWHNHKENKDEAIHGMDIRVDAMQIMTDVPEYLSIQQIQQATAQDKHLQWVKILYNYRLPGHQRAITPRHQSIKDDMLVKDCVMMKGRCIIIPKALQQQVLDQLHVNHMGIEKTKLQVGPA